MSCKKTCGNTDQSKIIVAGTDITGQEIVELINTYLGSEDWQSGADPVDETAPSVPTGLAANSITQTGFNLTWAQSTDNVLVTGYRIYQDGTLIGTSATPSFAVSGLSANTAYDLTISAFDAQGNTSAQSIALTVTTETIVTPPDPVLVYQFQFDNTSDDVSFAPSIDQSWLDTNATLVPLASITGAGVTINYSGVGRIGFAIQNVGAAGEFEIRNALDVVITSSTFDTPYYNNPIETEILISKNIITPSNVFFKFIEL